MATITPILKLINMIYGEQSYGSFSDYGAVQDENLRLIELALGEVTSKSLASTTPVNLTADEHNSAVLRFSGTLSANIVVETEDRKGFWFVTNDCTGAYTVTLATDTGSGVVIPQGGKAIVFSDGTNIVEIYTPFEETALAAEIFAASGKTTPVDADTLAITDSAASNGLKKLTWANLKATLKTYFDSVTTTLSNKTLTSPVLTTPQINDTSSDHQYIFAGSELAADRTVTLPLLAANDEFVFKAHNIQAQATWEAGVGTTESLVTPAKIAAAIAALATTPNYGNGNAALSYGGVGTYVFGFIRNTGVEDGSTYAGSAIEPGGFDSSSGNIADDGADTPRYTKGSTALSGTWRAMGRAAGTAVTRDRLTLFLRTV